MILFQRQVSHITSADIELSHVSATYNQNQTPKTQVVQNVLVLLADLTLIAVRALLLAVFKVFKRVFELFSQVDFRFCFFLFYSIDIHRVRSVFMLVTVVNWAGQLELEVRIVIRLAIGVVAFRLTLIHKLVKATDRRKGR
ncbi:hypothetical protein HG530_002239 [Fusarium avenaceum]|nr:hypothetical protein HG530_002239 [Fusarium avenaceum]